MTEHPTLYQMKGNVKLERPSRNCHLNFLYKEMSNAVRSYILLFKYSTTFGNQEPDLTMDLTP